MRRHLDRLIDGFIVLGSIGLVLGGFIGVVYLVDQFSVWCALLLVPPLAYLLGSIDR